MSVFVCSVKSILSILSSGSGPLRWLMRMLFTLLMYCDQCWCKERMLGKRAGRGRKGKRERSRERERESEQQYAAAANLSFPPSRTPPPVSCINPLLSRWISRSVDPASICICCTLTDIIALTDMTQCLLAQHMLRGATFSRLLDYRLSTINWKCECVPACVFMLSPFQRGSLKRKQTCLSECPSWPLMLPKCG